MTEKKEESGVATPEGAGTETPAVETPKEVASTEVKPAPQETPAVQTETVDAAKLQEQIENLNTALKQEREASKKTAKELQEELERSKETIDKLKDVFSPEQPEEVQEEALTLEKIEELLEQKEAQRLEEQRKEEQMKAIKAEVSKLEKEWDGSNGKPKYDDKAVIEWQEANNKLYLSPREAFNEMNRDAIIDWEIQNRMSSKPSVENVVTPGGAPVSREPVETTPKTTQELRSAVLEAMDIASGENTN